MNTTETKSGFWAADALSMLGGAVSDHASHMESQGVYWDRFGSLAVYVFSVYGILTFFVALVLNRTAVIALLSAARPHQATPIGWLRRVPVTQAAVLTFLRTLAILLLLEQVGRVLVGLSVVQLTATSCSRLTRHIPAYFTYTPAAYGADKYMAMPRHEVRYGPTSDMLWPVYLTVCWLLFVETFALTLENKKPLVDGGITLFELSMAIQEMSLGFFFVGDKAPAKRPSEQLLLICLFSLLDHVANHVGALVYLNRYRLVPLTVLNVFFLWYFVASVAAHDFLKFPLEISFTYLCLAATLAVTAACFAVSALAVLAKGRRVNELNLASYLAAENPDNDFVQRHLNVSMLQDFYTAALNVGLVAITMAGRHSYIVAYGDVALPQGTWLDKPPAKSAYANVILDPPQHLLGASDAQQMTGSTLKQRLRYLREISSRCWQVLAANLTAARVKLIGVFRPREETLEDRRSRAPPFLQHLIQEPEVEEPDSDEDYELSSDEEYDAAELDDPSDLAEIDLTETLHTEIDLTTNTGLTEEVSAMAELITPASLLELLDMRDLLQLHLEWAGPGKLTRAVHTRKEHDQRQDLEAVLRSRRVSTVAQTPDGLDLDPRVACVVCQVQPRELIVWPCKCFSICEECRLTLVTKGITGCVCCRRDVEGVSRVYVP